MCQMQANIDAWAGQHIDMLGWKSDFFVASTCDFTVKSPNLFGEVNPTYPCNISSQAAQPTHPDQWWIYLKDNLQLCKLLRILFHIDATVTIEKSWDDTNNLKHL